MLACQLGHMMREHSDGHTILAQPVAVLAARLGRRYDCTMSFLSRIVRKAAQRVVSDPRARDMAMKTGREVANEAKSIARNKDPARAAGRSFKRALKTFQQEKSQGKPEHVQSRIDGPKDKRQ